MAFGITPARGNWEQRRSAISGLAQAAFQKGDLVSLDHTRTVSVYTSTRSSYLGVALHDSGNSLPAGFATIAIPRPGCTAYLDTGTAEPASSLSFGQVGSIVSALGRTSVYSSTINSAFSQFVTIVGPIDTALSRIEVAFAPDNGILYSGSTHTLNN